MKIKLTLTPEAAEIVRRMYESGQLADAGVVGMKEVGEFYQTSLAAAVSASQAVPIVPRRFFRYGIVKRGIDLVLAAVLLILAGPLLLLTALAVKLTSRGPAFYSQKRVGWGGRPFTIYKLRSMYHNCESATGPCWSRPGDTRIMPLGRVLRRLHIDELPQLWNVVRGDMSLIGPRSERPEFVPRLARALPHYNERFSVRPGIIGFAQVFLPPEAEVKILQQKLAYDLYYIQHQNLWLDLRILIATTLRLFPWAIRLILPISEQVVRQSLTVEPRPF